MMQPIGGALVLVGFIMAFGAQFYIVFIAFKKRFIYGMGCIFIPAYFLYFALRKDVRKMKPIIIWGMGFVFIVLGTVVESF